MKEYAHINVVVECDGCGKILSYREYHDGVIEEIEKSIKENNWEYDPLIGNLCPECQRNIKLLEKEIESEVN